MIGRQAAACSSSQSPVSPGLSRPSGTTAVASVITEQLFGKKHPEMNAAEIERLRQAVLDKNYHWFSRYRVVDGYNVFGGRSKLAWFGQSNADVMMRAAEWLCAREETA